MALKHTHGRIVTKVDLNQKNGVTWEDGTELVLERDFNNLDRKYTSQVLGTVIDAENIPSGAIVLFHHNSVHDTYEIFNHSALSGEEIASGIKIYSIMERDVFFWKMPNDEDWKPTKGFDTALRVFQPYTGTLVGIEPNQIKDTLYITSGKYKGLCCRTVDHADYMITFRDPQTGKDMEIIRIRADGNEEDGREPEVIAIDHYLTDEILKGNIFVGLNISDCKPLIF